MKFLAVVVIAILAVYYVSGVKFSKSVQGSIKFRLKWCENKTEVSHKEAMDYMKAKVLAPNPSKKMQNYLFCRSGYGMKFQDMTEGKLQTGDEMKTYYGPFFEKDELEKLGKCADSSVRPTKEKTAMDFLQCTKTNNIYISDEDVGYTG